MKAFWNILSTLLITASVVTRIQCCDVKAIKQCLLPVKNQLSSFNKFPSEAGLFQLSIEHYLEMLDDQHSQFIHISSLNTIMKRIDNVFVKPKDFAVTCKTLTTAEKCLKNIIVLCDEETRDELEGLQNMFNFMCQTKHRQAYWRNFKCLTRSDLNRTRNDISSTLENNLNAISQPEPNTNYTLIGGDKKQGEEGEKFDIYGGGIHLWYNNNNNGDNENHYQEVLAFTTQVCRAVTSALQGYEEAVMGTCNKTAAEWAFQLRHSLVQILLIDLQCEHEDEYVNYKSLLNETGCFACFNGDVCIDWTLHCDGQIHCNDSSDESNCDTSGSTAITVIIVVLVVLCVVLVVIICVIKCREEVTSGLHRSISKSTEMMSITQEAMELGDSTPPLSTNAFTYTQVPNSANA